MIILLIRVLDHRRFRLIALCLSCSKVQNYRVIVLKYFCVTKKSDNEPLCPLNTLQNTLVCCTRTTLFLLYIGNWFCQYFSRWHILPRFACFYNLIYFSAYFYTMFCLFFPGFPLISAIFYHFSFFRLDFYMTKYAVFSSPVFPRKKSRNGYFSPFRDFSFLYKYASPAVIHTSQFL